MAALRLSVRGAGRRPSQAATARELKLELPEQSLSCRYGYKLPGGCLCGAGLLYRQSLQNCGGGLR